MATTAVAHALLSLVTSDERAESIVGDFAEDARSSNSGWFWSQVTRTAAALFFVSAARSPARLLALGFGGALLWALFGLALAIVLGVSEYTYSLDIGTLDVFLGAVPLPFWLRALLAAALANAMCGAVFGLLRGAPDRPNGAVALAALWTIVFAATLVYARAAHDVSWTWIAGALPALPGIFLGPLLAIAVVARRVRVAAQPSAANRGGRSMKRILVGVVVVLLAAVGGFAALVAARTDGTVETFPLDGLMEELAVKVPALQQPFLVPGVAVGIISEGRVWDFASYGLADRERGIAVDENTVFGVASLSKTLTAWGVMHLVDSGSVDLDAPVSRYLTRWSLPPSEFDHDQVTVRRLLSHTGGISHRSIGSRWAPNVPVEQYLSNPDMEPGPVRVVYEPGTEQRYSGGGYAILQLMIEEVTKKPFSEYMRDEVLRPLGMHSSYFGSLEQPPKMAMGYDADGSAIGRGEPSHPALAAGGLRTTLQDLLTFTVANLSYDADRTQGVISLDSLHAMRAAARENHFGLGYERVGRIPEFLIFGGVDALGHTGGQLGWTALFGYIPETGDALVVLQNSPNGIILQIACVWAQKRFGKCPPMPDMKPIPSELRAEMAGTYAVADQPVVELKAVDGALVWSQGQTLLSVVLTEDFETFRPLFAPQPFRLERGADGSVTGIRIRRSVFGSYVANRMR